MTARRRRLLTFVAIAAVGVLTASLALAATKGGWLTGSPAPLQVVTGFEQYTPQLGFHPEAGIALDSEGNTVAEAEISLLHSDYDAKGRLMACGGGVTPVGPSPRLPTP